MRLHRQSAVMALVMHILGAALLAWACMGCSSKRTTEGTRVLERVETPTADGGKRIRETERTTTEEETLTKADLSAAVAALQAALAGLRGDIPGAIGALIPKPAAQPTLLGMTAPEIIGAAGALWTAERGVAAWHKRRRIKAEAKPTKE